MLHIRTLNFLVFLVFLVTTKNSFCQVSKNKTQNFKILKQGEVYSEKQLIEAVEKVDWCGYFHKNENFKINFSDGTIIALLNEKELNDSELNLKPNCFQSDNIEDNAIYSIHSSGILLREVKKDSHVKSFKK